MLKLLSSSSFHTKAGPKKGSADRHPIAARNVHHQRGLRSQGKSKSGDVSDECEELLNQTIVTLKKCMDGLPQNSDGTDVCMASSCGASQASMDAKQQMTENNGDNAHPRSITDTKRLSQNLDVEQDKDGLLFGSSLKAKVQMKNNHIGEHTQSRQSPTQQSGHGSAATEPISEEGLELQETGKDIVPVAHGNNAVQLTVAERYPETLQNMYTSHTKEIQDFYRYHSVFMVPIDRRLVPVVYFT